MKSKTKMIIILCFSLGTSVPGMAQSEAEAMTYQAYLTTNKSLWKQSVETLQGEYSTDGSNERLYQLTLAEHGLLNATMVDQDETLFDQHYKKAKKNLETLIEAGYQEGHARALLSSVYGMEMGYSSWKGMFLGAKSGSNLEKAKKLSPTSPLVWQVYANSKLFTPAMFGGDVQEAVEAFEKSVELYEAGQGSTRSNWRYLDALAWLGQAYQKTGKTAQARETYEKALEIEPGFGWVKFVLLPNVKPGQ